MIITEKRTIRIVRKYRVGSDHSRYQHVCMIKLHGRILTIKVNTGWTHAERAAIKSIKNQEVLKKCTLYSYRMDEGDNRLRNARPCKDCLRLIREVGIRRVIYSDADGIEREMEF